MFNKISDKSIIEGIRNQDDETLNWLYDNYFQTVKNHIIKNSGSNDDCSDVFQDSIIVLYNQIMDNTLSLTTDLKGYFFGIARNIWSNQLRMKRATIDLDIDFPDNEDDEATVDTFFEKIVGRAFSKLKPDCQTVLTLFSEGYNYDEIAKKMKLKNEIYARRKKYLCKDALMELVKEDPDYQEFLRYQK